MARLVSGSTQLMSPRLLFLLCMQVVGSAAFPNHRSLGQILAMLPSATEPPCALEGMPSGGPLLKRGGGAVSVERQGSQRENQQPMKYRKLWLHDAVIPSPNGSNHQICRFCGSTLSSPNTSVRKKVWPRCIASFARYVFSRWGHCDEASESSRSPCKVA